MVDLDRGDPIGSASRSRRGNSRLWLAGARNRGDFSFAQQAESPDHWPYGAPALVPAALDWVLGSLHPKRQNARRYAASIREFLPDRRTAGADSGMDWLRCDFKRHRRMEPAPYACSPPELAMASDRIFLASSDFARSDGDPACAGQAARLGATKHRHRPVGRIRCVDVLSHSIFYGVS